jgi:hypothetical protein
MPREGRVRRKNASQGVRSGEAHIDPAAEEGTQHAFRAVHHAWTTCQRAPVYGRLSFGAKPTVLLAVRPSSHRGPGILPRQPTQWRRRHPRRATGHLCTVGQDLAPSRLIPPLCVRRAMPGRECCLGNAARWRRRQHRPPANGFRCGADRCPAPSRPNPPVCAHRAMADLRCRQGNAALRRSLAPAPARGQNLVLTSMWRRRRIVKNVRRLIACLLNSCSGRMCSVGRWVEPGAGPGSPFVGDDEQGRVRYANFATRLLEPDHDQKPRRACTRRGSRSRVCNL